MLNRPVSTQGNGPQNVPHPPLVKFFDIEFTPGVAGKKGAFVTKTGAYGYIIGSVPKPVSVIVQKPGGVRQGYEKTTLPPVSIVCASDFSIKNTWGVKKMKKESKSSFRTN